MEQKIRTCNDNKEDARTLNAYLETLQVKVHEAHRELLLANKTLTVEELKNKLTGKSEERSRMLMEIFSEHHRQMDKLIENSEKISPSLNKTNRHFFR